MTLQALLVSKDDEAAETLARIMAGHGIALERSSDPEIAASRLAEQSFDAVVVDFDDAGSASTILHATKQATDNHTNQVLSLALVSDTQQIRGILGAGAHFVLSKPISQQQTNATLRAATSLLNRERRRAFRVPVQAAASLALADGTQMEGIMLDLSKTGMDVLAAQPLAPSSLLNCRFVLPDGSAEIETQGEVAWADPNGQSGVRFVEMDESHQATLEQWLMANSPATSSDDEELSQCKLTDLSLGGCYVETDGPFPESSSVDLCLRAAEMEFHAEGTVRVMHPGHGMGIEFPSRTNEQRKVVGDFIEFLTSQPGTMPELFISPKSLISDDADVSTPTGDDGSSEDPLLELLRGGRAMEQGAFLAELRRQRNSEPVNS